MKNHVLNRIWYQKNAIFLLVLQQNVKNERFFELFYTVFILKLPVDLNTLPFDSTSSILAKFTGENVSNSEKRQTDYVLKVVLSKVGHLAHVH